MLGQRTAQVAYVCLVISRMPPSLDYCNDSIRYASASSAWRETDSVIDSDVVVKDNDYVPRNVLQWLPFATIPYESIAESNSAPIKPSDTEHVI